MTDPIYDALCQDYDGACRDLAKAHTEIQTLRDRVAALEADLAAMIGPCAGQCSCAIWGSRHDAAMALYDEVGRRKALEAANVELHAINLSLRHQTQS